MSRWGPAWSRGNDACDGEDVQEGVEGWTDGWMVEGEGTARGRERKDEMKVELSMEGLIEDDQGRTSKNII